MRYFHIETNEWIDSKELQKRLEIGFDFRCNDCKKSVGKQLGVVSEGIFCKSCKNKLMKELMSKGGIPMHEGEK